MAEPAPDTLSAVRDLAAVTALTETQITEAVEQAVVDTYRRLVEDDPDIHARVDLTTSSWRLYRLDGDGEAEIPVSHFDFTRQAAAAARAAVTERLAEADRRHVMAEAASHQGELLDAVVERRAGTAWYLDAAGVPALLPPEEQIPREAMEPRQHLKVVVIDGRRRGQDAVVVVSRSHPLLVQRLMEQEVPELQSGQVVIRGIARDPGKRTKVAVDAPDGDIDPQGACIGPRGVRQRAVTSELGEEQVQIVAWAADPATYVANALIPATAKAVELDEDSRTAHVAVPSDQLSLAIGRAGENARLAARLSGWRIDIHPADGDGR
jgi:N utilization substance protein A